MVILNNELNNKYSKKRMLTKSFKLLQTQLRRTLSYVEFNTLLYRLTLYTSSKKKLTCERHEKKLAKLHTAKDSKIANKCNNFIKQVVHNISDYELNQEEEIALSFG